MIGAHVVLYALNYNNNNNKNDDIHFQFSAYGNIVVGGRIKQNESILKMFEFAKRAMNQNGLTWNKHIYIYYVLIQNNIDGDYYI